VKNIVATDFSGTTEASQLAINEIGEVNIKLSKAIYFDAYNDNKSNGAFILIDATTNTTGSRIYKIVLTPQLGFSGEVQNQNNVGLK
jgi:sulfate adenylyltransferase subunit 1 (EFTu-like GTPase family)